MSKNAITYVSDSMSRGECIQIDLYFEVAGSGNTITQNHTGNAALITFGALTQAQIDQFLGSASEINYLAFDGTALGTDAMGLIFNFGGQVDKLISVTYETRSSTALGTVAAVTLLGSAATTLANSTLANGIMLTAAGNVAARIVLSGQDSLTNYVGKLSIVWRSK